LQATLREDLDRISLNRDTIGEANQRIASFVEGVESGRLEQEEFTSGIFAVTRFTTINPRYGPYETLKARGIDLISDESLRVKITTLYEDELPNLVEDSIIDRRRSTDRILPSILAMFWLDASRNWVLKDAPPTNWQNDLVTLGRCVLGSVPDFICLPSNERSI